MKYSQLLIPTTREVPAEAEIPSHQLMIRAGFIRKLASGTYTYLATGLRSLRKVMQIVREEMDAAGAQEIAMPILQPIELWRKTGREADYGPTMCKFQDRHGRINALAPTAEEVVTHLVACEINSYKQLPVNLYQINTKFRDEFRPRFGVLRSREFIMKDAYSFDTTLEGLQANYDAMAKAYRRIFTRCGVPFVVVQAQSGEIGGSGSEEFMVPCSAGEDIIVHTEDGAYAANIEKAGIDAPPAATPAADAPAMEEVHTPGVGSIEDVCRFLGAQPEQMIKTLIFWHADEAVAARIQDLHIQIAQAERELAATNDAGAQAAQEASAEELSQTTHEEAMSTEASAGLLRDKVARLRQELCDTYAKLDVSVAVLRGDHEINEAKLRGVLGRGPVELADEQVIRNISGADVGFAGPMGLAEKGVRLVIDPAVAAMGIGVTGANRTDHHTKNVVPGRDFPLEGEHVRVADIRNAVEGDTWTGKPLQFNRGIEVGHIFQLGTKYSEALGATFQDEDGQTRPAVMGCYGIGINRILASAIEAGHDDNGCVLPISIAPFEVEIVPLNNDKEQVQQTADSMYTELKAAGVDVLLDDRDLRPGVKFKDADLLGIPLRVVIGERGLKEGNVEIKRRTDDKPTGVPVADAVKQLLAMREELWNRLQPEA